MKVTSLAQLAGTWRFERLIEDNTSDLESRVDGRAEFSKANSVWTYHETGTMTRADGARFEAERRYLYSETASGVAVSFDDGRPFHEFAWSDTVQVHHHCPPDTYRGVYDFSRWPVWSLTWNVSGPRKHYRSRTRFWRA